MATVAFNRSAAFIIDDRAARLASAEVVLTKVLSMAPQHAPAHLILGAVQIFTSRAAQGIAECQHALALDRNLADAHGWIGLAKYFLGRGAETEAHIHEAFCLSPRDTFAYRWMHIVGIAKMQLGADVEAVTWFHRSVEANRSSHTHFFLAAALALLGELDEARAAARSGLVLDSSFTIRRYRAIASSDNPVYLAGCDRISTGMRVAGLPEG
jgi:tetratricopeptide (TPR) repeat protein